MIVVVEDQRREVLFAWMTITTITENLRLQISHKHTVVYFILLKTFQPSLQGNI